MSSPPQSATLPFQEIVVVDDSEPHSAAFNMAVDEMLLEGLEIAPLLRCYRWKVPAVSFGCFGKVAEVRRNFPGRDLVRRWTGGGIVEHGDDFTFTLFVPHALPLTTLPATESYRLIHGVVAEVLSAEGLSVEAVDNSYAASSEADDDAPNTAAFLKPCFSNPVPHDLLAAGHKIAGGAQRRTKRGLLHQGSIQGRELRRMQNDDWRGRLAGSLAARFATRFTARPLTAAEYTSAEQIAASRYATRAWMERR